MKKEISLSVGQQVFVKYYQNDGTLRPMTVAKVGRSWATLDTNGPYKKTLRAPIGSRYLDGAGYRSPGTIYLSESEYDEHRRIQSAWRDFRDMVQGCHHAPDLTLEQIVTMHKIVEGAIND